MFTRLNNLFLICLVATLFGDFASAQIVNPSAFEKVRQDTARTIKNKLNPVITRYCRDACQVVNVNVEVEEQVESVDDLGFEGVTGETTALDLVVSKAVVEIQVDDRITTVNRERLRTIMLNNLNGMAVDTDVIWRPVTIPQIGTSLAAEEQLKRQVTSKISRAIDQVIEKYCPETCVLSDVQVDGALITHDEATGISSKQIVSDKAGLGILRIDAVDAEVAMDLSLSDGRRSQIASIMRAKTRFVEPVNLAVSVVAFPDSYASIKDQQDAQLSDPYGLEKLRRMLVMFRDLAGTKEIITSNTSTASEKIDQTEKEKSTSAARSIGAVEDAGMDPLEIFLYIAATIGAILVGFLVFRAVGASRDAKEMQMMAHESGRGSGGGIGVGGSAQITHKIEGNGTEVDAEGARKEIAMKLKCDELRRELTRIFMELPRVSKETFARLLQEEGVELTAKYVHIFGHIVVFELLDDPQLQRELYELSEYYHNSEVEFDLAEELKLLRTLKNKVTANEIKVMTRKQLDQFDFLAKLDAAQIYNLISEEKPQMQSIVLTQLDHKRRRAVFDMYDGAPKVSLMHELCRADAIPKEYLANVAKALHKKVLSRPEFDTENLRSSDILLDLLEKSTLEEQRALMSNLVHTNADAARGIKLKLVTVELMPFLKDGHLLEIMLGLDRQDLMTFLAGAREHIRGLILAKAPEELAESWVEDLGNMAGYDEQEYRLTEMKILGRIRSLASNGAISLLDINDMIFGTIQSDNERENAMSINVDSDSSMVA